MVMIMTMTMMMMMMMMMMMGNDGAYEDDNQGSGDGKKLNMPQAQ